MAHPSSVPMVGEKNTRSLKKVAKIQTNLGTVLEICDVFDLLAVRCVRLFTAIGRLCNSLSRPPPLTPGHVWKGKNASGIMQMECSTVFNTNKDSHHLASLTKKEIPHGIHFCNMRQGICNLLSVKYLTQLPPLHPAHLHLLVQGASSPDRCLKRPIRVMINTRD